MHVFAESQSLTPRPADGGAAGRGGFDPHAAEPPRHARSVLDAPIRASARPARPRRPGATRARPPARDPNRLSLGVHAAHAAVLNPEREDHPGAVHRGRAGDSRAGAARRARGRPARPRRSWCQRELRTASSRARATEGIALRSSLWTAPDIDESSAAERAAPAQASWGGLDQVHRPRTNIGAKSCASAAAFGGARR